MLLIAKCNSLIMMLNKCVFFKNKKHKTKTVNVVVPYLIIQTKFWHNIKANPLRTIWWEEGLFPKPNLPDDKAKVTISVAQSPTTYHHPHPCHSAAPEHDFRISSLSFKLQFTNTTSTTVHNTPNIYRAS